jgi:hypothetical protein
VRSKKLERIFDGGSSVLYEVAPPAPLIFCRETKRVPKSPGDYFGERLSSILRSVPAPVFRQYLPETGLLPSDADTPAPHTNFPELP